MRWSISVVVILGLGLFAATGAGSPEPRWVITDLAAGTDWESPKTVAINDLGQIIGDGCPPGTYCNELDAFVWQDGKMTDLGTLGGTETSASAINDKGQVVGDGYTKTGYLHAFLWQNGHMNDLGTLSGTDSSAAGAINDKGQIVGWSGDARSGNSHAFLWQSGKMNDLGTLGGKSSTANAINDRGQVVGWSDTKTGAQHTFLWRNGRMSDLGTLGGKSSTPSAINDQGQIVGSSNTKTGAQHAFLWQNGKMTDLGTLVPFGFCLQVSRHIGSRSIAINERGHVAGTHEASNGGSRAFLWANGRMSHLAMPRRVITSGVSAMNERGQIVGWCGGPCVWENGRATRLPIIPGTEPDAIACGINQRGQIVGNISYHMDFSKAVLWTKRP